MATIKPFKAYRPRKDLVLRVQAPPYDVISTEEAREIAKDNPFSFLHITRSEIDLPEGIDPYDERVYQKARENLEKFIKEKVLVQDDEPLLYIYWQEMEGRRQHGIVGVFSCKEYGEGIIKKHEHTRLEKEEDRIKHIEYTGAQTGPVFLTYKAVSELKDLVKEALEKFPPEYDFTVDKVRHVFVPIRDRDLIKKVVEAFKKLPALYIADGHHRSAAAYKVWLKRKEQNPEHTGEEPYNYFLAVAFPHDELYIMDYNRVVKDLNGMDIENFLKKVKQYFEVEPVSEKGRPYKPQRKHEFGMYLGEKWYRLRAKPEIIKEEDPVKSLDVAILQGYLLDPILGIKNPRKDKRIEFVGGIKGLKVLEEKADKTGGVAFSMYPTSIEELMRVADAGLVMPPKSTWFEPKLRSGLFIHKIEE